MNRRRLLTIIGIVALAVVLVVVFDMILANHRPVIAGLKALERVVPSGSCQIVCNASDRDGDPLSYNWSASGGSISGTGAAVNWTAPDSAGSYNVTVTVTDNRGGQAVERVAMEVRANRAPTITDLAADADWTLPSGTLQMTCTASDPDGDSLSYEWTASAGDISGTGEAVNWTAPQEVGIYSVTVVVRDAHGSSTTRFISLSVVTGTPPTIEDMVITAKEPKYLKTSGYKYIVGRTKQYDIECIVSDTTGGVSYEWSCEHGEISGEGSMITWTAPDLSLASTTVTVIVSDIAGNKVSRSMVFQVASCTSCTFG